MNGFDIRPADQSKNVPAIGSTTTMITFECAIRNDENLDLALEETKLDVNGMEDIFKTMTVG